MGPTASQHADQSQIPTSLPTSEDVGCAATVRRREYEFSFRHPKLTVAADLDCSAVKKLLGWQSESDLGVLFRKTIDSHLKSVHGATYGASR